MSLLDMKPIQSLKVLQEKTGKDLFSILKKMYIETTPGVVSMMNDLFVDKEFSKLSREAHSLKSSSANIGAFKVAELCKSIEYKISIDNSFTELEIKCLIEQVNKVYSDTIVELSKVN